MKRIIVNVTEEQYEQIRKVSFDKKQSMSTTVRSLLTTLERATPLVRNLMAEKIQTLHKELKEDQEKIALRKTACKKHKNFSCGCKE